MVRSRRKIKRLSPKEAFIKFEAQRTQYYQCDDCQLLFRPKGKLISHQLETGHRSSVSKQLERNRREQMDISLYGKPANHKIPAPDGKNYWCTPCSIPFSGVSGLSKHFRENPTHRTEEQEHAHEVYSKRLKKVKAKERREEKKRLNGGTSTKDVTRSSDPLMKFCTSCSRPRKPDFKFCGFCGEKLPRG